MGEAVGELLLRLAGSPVLQGTIAALSTFVLEDPTTIGCGLLVADQRMVFATALVGVSLGIAVGDVGLYGIGRLLGPRLVRRWVSAPRLDRAAAWFRRNLVLAVVLSRFIPGMRLPTYVGAGLLRAPLGRFTAVAVAASLVWTFLLLQATIALGETIWPLLGRYRWPVAAAAVALLVVLQRRTAARLERSPEAPAATDGRSGEEVVSFFELWPPWLFYLPVVAYTLWLALRYRGLTLPTAANPSIYSGGFIGESKSQILDLVPPVQRSWVAEYVVVERRDLPAGDLAGEALQAMAAAGLELPVVAKPDLGQRGAGVWPIHDQLELQRYLQLFPTGERLLLQELVGSPTPPPASGELPAVLRHAREAGVLYWRMPGDEGPGSILSVTLKHFPFVTGDGQRTLAELIAADSRARLLQDVYLQRHQDELQAVPAAGARFPLVFAGNHCQGAIFKDGTGLVSPALLERIDAICRSIPGFYFGRLDLRFDDPAAFLRGEGFKIVEINGASAEATHIWDAAMTLTGAYRTLFEQFRILYAIGAANRRRGHRPLSLVTVLSDVRRYRRTARTYPETR